MADEAEPTDYSESAKSDEIAALKAALKEEQAALASNNNGSDQPKSGGSLADAQQQRYLERALNRTTQTNLSKFTSNRLKAIVPAGEGGDGAAEIQKDEQIKETFEKIRSADTEIVLGRRHPFLGITALICSIGVGRLSFCVYAAPGRRCQKSTWSNSIECLRKERCSSKFRFRAWRVLFKSGRVKYPRW